MLWTKEGWFKKEIKFVGISGRNFDNLFQAEVMRCTKEYLFDRRVCLVFNPVMVDSFAALFIVQ